MLLAPSILTLCLADLTAYGALALRGKQRHPVIINVPLIKKRFTFRATVLGLAMRHYMSYDANLGYRFKANAKPFRLLHRMPGNRRKFKEVGFKNFFEFTTDNHGFIKNSSAQDRDYAALAKDKSVYKVLICGNSVSVGYGVRFSENTWPALLEKSLNLHKAQLFPGYREVVVINSCVLGSTPPQELRKLQDEDIFLNPDLVLLFSACSTDYTYNGNPVDFSNHSQQKRMASALNNAWYVRYRYLLPNVFEYFSQRLAGLSKTEDALPFRKEGYPKVSAAKYNYSKVRQFKGICDTHNIDFLFFLQPGMGVGNKQYTKAEQNLVQYFERYFFEKNWDDYVRDFRAYLAEMQPLLTEDYQHDLIGVFDNVAETVYSDPRHQNELGHQILATTIEAAIGALMKKKSIVGNATERQAA